MKNERANSSFCILHSEFCISSEDDLEIVLRSVPSMFRARLGVARGKFVAEAAARQAQAGQISMVPPGTEQSFLAPLPASLLSVTPDLARGFQQQGLHTLGALSSLPLGPVQAQFGAAGGRAWRLARGQDDRPFQPRARALKAEARLRFPTAVASEPALLAGLERVLVRAFSLPVTRGRAAEQITLRAWAETMDDGRRTTVASPRSSVVHRPSSPPRSSWERTFTLREPVASAATALKQLRGRLANARPEGAVAELGVMLVLKQGASVIQEELWSGRRRQLLGVAEAARQLRMRFGDAPAGQLYRIMEVEPWSRFPERRWALVDCNF
jgi:DNA polymerase-4/protein ImuB